MPLGSALARLGARAGIGGRGRLERERLEERGAGGDAPPAAASTRARRLLEVHRPRGAGHGLERQRIHEAQRLGEHRGGEHLPAVLRALDAEHALGQTHHAQALRPVREEEHHLLTGRELRRTTHVLAERSSRSSRDFHLGDDAPGALERVAGGPRHPALEHLLRASG
ncbi:hypothetical protein ACN28I_22320 [Archangium gephyra]|uniref:hypothetical protein n=1 Tax=Archangium gephyra TaxID=48 RepID=UPI003B80EC0E